MTQSIVFMGTPDFAVASLAQLIKKNIEVKAVITVPDKPAGRGQQLHESAVKKFAREQGLTILQPANLKDETFLAELRDLNADLFVVVAFRMLPELVWAMPPLGTINLHGSLLPQYRGAAPINWAVINGDSETGATTFFIEKEIDTGKIIDQVKLLINIEDNAGIVHDALMEKGAILLADTVISIFNGTAKAKPQTEFEISELKPAPKLFKENCRIDWSLHRINVYNKIRGLSPYPAAWTELIHGEQKKSLKIYSSKLAEAATNCSNKIRQEKNQIFIGCADGWLEILELQLEGKKRMTVQEFVNGFNLCDWKTN